MEIIINHNRLMIKELWIIVFKEQIRRKNKIVNAGNEKNE